MLRHVLFLAIAVVGLVGATSRAAADTEPPLPGFVSQTAPVNGVRIHYVHGGSGPALVLLHGFPEDWSEYRAIMPRLAQRYTLIVPDLRGIGGSTGSSGFDAVSMAEDVHQLLAALQLSHVYLVGHDIGGQVAYAYVRRYPETLRGAMILDSPLAGLDGWDEALANPRTAWHVGFLQTPELPEQLLAGRQAAFLGYFLDFGRHTPAEKTHFLEAYATQGNLRAVLGIYRAIPENAKWNVAQRGPNATPIVLANGEKSPFVAQLPKFAGALRASGFSDVETATIPNAVHYLVGDNPDAVAELIERHAGS